MAVLTLQHVCINRAVLTGLYQQVIMAFLIGNSDRVGVMTSCQDEASSITYSAIWPQEIIAGAKVMVNFITLPCDPSGTPIALLPLPIVTPPTHPL